MVDARLDQERGTVFWSSRDGSKTSFEDDEIDILGGLQSDT